MQSSALMNPTVREIVADDAQALFVLTGSFATSFSTEQEPFARALRTLINQEDAWLGGAEVDGELIGYCLGFEHYTLYANGKVAWVEEIMVRAEHRRRGVGRALMTAFEEWSRARGARLCGLATRRASSFYASIGYEESAVFFRKVY